MIHVIMNRNDPNTRRRSEEGFRDPCTHIRVRVIKRWRTRNDKYRTMQRTCVRIINGAPPPNPSTSPRGRGGVVSPLAHTRYTMYTPLLCICIDNEYITTIVCVCVCV